MSLDRPLEKAKAMVLLIPRGPLTDEMLRDVRRARELGKPIIAVLRSGYAMPQGLDDATLVRADEPSDMADKIAAALEPSR